MRKPRRRPAAEVAPFVLDLPAARPGRPDPAAPPIEPVAWAAVLGTTNPDEVEIGSGKGLFLVTAAAAAPGRNFLGVEIARKYQLYAANRLAGRGLANARVCCGDGLAVLAKCAPPGSVAAVHVYFPDPWWKAKHKKRLLFTPAFADAVAQALTPGGVLHFVTDVADYFAMVTGLLAGHPAFRELPPPAEATPSHDMDYLTNFERKFRKEGRPIHRARYERTSAF